MGSQSFLGIDFGTTNTVISITGESKDSIIDTIKFDGADRIRTAVGLDDEGKLVRFGDEVIDRLEKGDRSFSPFINFKPFIATNERFPGEKDSYTADELALIFLRRLREKIEEVRFAWAPLDDNMNTTIGYPALWNKTQQERLAEITQEAGFPNVAYCQEPLAAMYHYTVSGMELDDAKKRSKVFFIDFGGGTTDIVMGDVFWNGKNLQFDENDLAHDGDSSLGGRHFDSKLKEAIFCKAEEDGLLPHRFSDTADNVISAAERVRVENAVRELKENLSMNIIFGKKQADYHIRELSFLIKGTCLSGEMTKEGFENICIEPMNRWRHLIESCLRKYPDVSYDNVIPVGGSSCFYFVDDDLKKYFPNKIASSKSSADLKEIARERFCAVSNGLAIRGKTYRLGLVIKKSSIAEKPYSKPQDISSGSGAWEVIRAGLNTWLWEKSKVIREKSKAAWEWLKRITDD
jgi:molecular chaperone DnaK (HSP70)